MSLPNFVPAGVALLLIAVGGTAAWYRATYHSWPGMIPPAVHWCGRDYQIDSTETWAQVTAAQTWPVRVVGSYPLLLGHPLLAAPFPGQVKPGDSCATAVYLRTGPGRYQAYTLEGGP
jgi:hypothetical protein